MKPYFQCLLLPLFIAGLLVASPAQEKGPVTPVPAVKKDFIFLDVFSGASFGILDAKFHNSSELITEGDLGLTSLPSGDSNSYETFKMNSLKLNTAPVLGARAGIYSEIVGFDVEFQHVKHRTRAQGARLNRSGLSSDVVLDDGYLVVESYILFVDLLIRVPLQWAQPYLSLGLGDSFNTVSSPRAYSYHTVDLFAPSFSEKKQGWALKAALGVRKSLHAHFDLFVEWRYHMNFFNFNRNVPYEKDEILMRTQQVLAGAGFTY